MTHYQIKHRWTGAVLYEGEAETLGALVGTAVNAGASLVGASLVGASVLPGGVTFKEFVDNVVPALLAADGVALADVVTTEQRACHEWSNCPMHTVFGANQVKDVPAVWRSHADLFLALFDSKILTLEMVRAACKLDAQKVAA